MKHSVVMKFGGSSLATLDKIQNVARIIKQKKQEYENVVVVVSAMGNSTSELIHKAQGISKNPSQREMDVLLASGEQVSIALLAIALEAIDQKALSLTGWQVGIKTYGTHTKQRIASIDTQRIQEALGQSAVVIVAGFQGVDSQNDISTLGRGGSDTSAVALACALQYECEIYTDVDGIYTVDPRIHKKARKLKTLSYEETMEMANLGAKVLEPRSVELASRYKVPISILLNSADTPGTTIKEQTDMMEENTITNVSVMGDVVLINIDTVKEQDFNVADFFIQLANKGISVDVISQTYKEDLSFTIVRDDMVRTQVLMDLLNITNYHLKDDVIKVSVIGNAMRNQPGVAASVFKVFVDEDIKFYQVSTSEISISYIVDAEVKNRIVLALANQFEL